MGAAAGEGQAAGKATSRKVPGGRWDLDSWGRPRWTMNSRRWRWAPLFFILFYYFLLGFRIGDFRDFLPTIFLVLSASRENPCEPIIHRHGRDEEGRISERFLGYS
ncbi:hypothetical protein BDV09DRAFT_127420 [Aspergillus tetrazonus]